MATILVVDDEPKNRDLIVGMLQGLDHLVVEAVTGEAALALMETTPVDLVLLDVMMPGLNGFEVVHRIRQRTADDFLPIMLLTALDDSASRIQGLSVGADELLTKPINRSELLLRTSSLLRLREQERTLRRQNVELKDLHRFREEMSALLVHDLKNPLSVVLASLALVKDDATLSPPSLAIIDDATLAGERVIRLLNNLLDVVRQEQGQLTVQTEAVDLLTFVRTLANQRLPFAREASIELTCAIDPDVAVDVDRDLIARVLENVLDNAFRHVPDGGRIHLAAERGGDWTRLRIANTGPAIPVESRELVFEKFRRASPQVGRMNLGLGLYFCKLAVEAHGGRIWIEETAAFPTAFVLELPCRRHQHQTARQP
jgi:two-component system, sensor histidine kinase and response regulator